MVNHRSMYLSKRFQIRGGKLHEIRPLTIQSNKFTKEGVDFASYWLSTREYMKNLSTVNSTSDQCDFCEFSIDYIKKAYINSKGLHFFVGNEEFHKKLFDLDLIITSSHSGWHAINEMILPKSHVDILNSDSYFDHYTQALKRWKIQKKSLMSKIPSKVFSTAYNGLVENYKIGRSVYHSHHHCYTSLHRLEMLNDLQNFVLCPISKNSAFEFGITSDDHPNLMAVYKNPNDIALDDYEVVIHLAREMKRVRIIANTFFQYLFQIRIPMSVGWFYLEYPEKKLYFFAIPMKRHGTIQVFQGDHFNKFSQEHLLRHANSLLKEIVENKNDTISG